MFALTIQCPEDELGIHVSKVDNYLAKCLANVAAIALPSI